MAKYSVSRWPDQKQRNLLEIMNVKANRKIQIQKQNQIPLQRTLNSYQLLSCIAEHYKIDNSVVVSGFQLHKK